jgi:hypothetical protein
MNASILSLALLVLSGPAVETAKEPNTHLYVRTAPPGGKIIVDERPGTTDGLFSVTPGKHRVVVELDGYAPDRREVDVPQGRITRVEVSLKSTNDSYDGRSMAEWKRLVLNELNAEIRAKAMDALEAFGNRGRAEEAVAAIKAALAQEKDKAVIEAAYRALFRLGAPAVRVLLDGFRSQDPKARWMAVKAPYSGRRAKDWDRYVVPEQVVAAVIAATRDPDSAVRGEACYALGWRAFAGPNHENWHKIIATLIKALDDEEPTEGGAGIHSPFTVQSVACASLGRLRRFGAKVEGAVPALTRIVQSKPKELRPNESVLSSGQREALRFLGELGPAAKAAIPVLQAMQKEPRYQNDRDIDVAIKTIQASYGGPGVAATKQPPGPASKAPPTAIAAAKQPAAKGPMPRAGEQETVTAPGEAVTTLSPDSKEEPIESALRQKGKIEYKQVPMTEALRAIERQMKVNVVVDAKGMEDSGIDLATTLVSLSLENVSWGSVLDVLASQAGLTWAIKDGVLLITTEERASQDLTTRVYPTADLTSDHEALVRAIKTTIAPGSWRDSGGPGSIFPGPGSRPDRLVIHHAYRVHRQVRQLLSALRSIAAETGAGKTTESVVLYGAPTASASDIRSLRKALAQLVSFDFQETPLKEVAAYVKDTSKIPLVLDGKELNAVSLDPSTAQVSFRVSKVPLQQALSLMLRQFDLTWTLEGDYVRITTTDAADLRLVVGVYPVGDLAPDRKPDKLIEIITRTVAPQQWESQGGQGAIAPVMLAGVPVLVVSQTDPVHRHIAALLAQLRAKDHAPADQAAPKAKPGAADTLIVKMTADLASAVVDKPVSVKIDVTNGGFQPLTGVVVTATLDPALKPIIVTEGFEKGASGFTWTIAAFGSRETRHFEIQCQCLRPANEADLRAQVTSQQGTAGEDRLRLAIRAAPGQ